MQVSDRDVDVGGAFGLAFHCGGDNQNRAAAVQDSVSVTFAWSMDFVEPARDGEATWPNCPGGPVTEERNATCVRTTGFGQYEVMPLTRQWISRVGGNDHFGFGIGLKARAAD